MAHLYKTVEWQSGSGRWYVNDVQELCTVASRWWTPVRMLKMTPNDYVLMLRDKFKAGDFVYTAEKNVLIFSFDTQADARKYKNWINAQARKANYICGA